MNNVMDQADNFTKSQFVEQSSLSKKTVGCQTGDKH